MTRASPGGGTWLALSRTLVESFSSSYSPNAAIRLGTSTARPSVSRRLARFLRFLLRLRATSPVREALPIHRPHRWRRRSRPCLARMELQDSIQGHPSPNPSHDG